MRSLFEEESVELSDIVDVEYLKCTEDGLIQYARLSDKISKAEANRLKSDTKGLVNAFGRRKDFPFTVTKFDKLNRLEAMNARIILAEIKIAVRERDLIVAHLIKQSKRVLDDILDEYEFLEDTVKQNKIKPASIVESGTVAYGKTIEESVYNNHYKEATKISQKIQNSIMRKDELKKAKDYVTTYSKATSMSNATRLMFTEGTRVTTETIGEAFQDTGLKYYSVYVKDGKACETCVGISKKQKAHPVRFNDMKVGENAPPFHAYCRCHIEIAR